jgi:8-oxo-(d)GTP phosphatase
MTLSVHPVAPAGIDVLAAGAVLWRAGAAGPELALVHRPGYDDWSFPKGKLSAGEAMPFAAVREVAEETGYGCRLGPVLGDVRYHVIEGSKLVRYWAAHACRGAFAANAETDQLRWVDLDTAAGLLSYERDRLLLGRFAEVAPPASVVLLVRHAKAGNRQQWTGDDADRPLSGSGRAQAARLDELLTLFGPDRIVSAPPLRCRQTMLPVAERLDLTPVAEPLFGEIDYWDDPAAGLARLCEFAAVPGVTAISSQGGVIPDLIASLAAGRRLPGVDPDDVPARKASTWVLTFGPDGLRAADYYPDPTAP